MSPGAIEAAAEAMAEASSRNSVADPSITPRTKIDYVRQFKEAQQRVTTGQVDPWYRFENAVTTNSNAMGVPMTVTCAATPSVSYSASALV